MLAQVWHRRARRCELQLLRNKLYGEAMVGCGTCVCSACTIQSVAAVQLGRLHLLRCQTSSSFAGIIS